MQNRLVIALGLVLVTGSLTAAQVSVTAVQADGEEATGVLNGINAESVTLDARKIPARELVQIKFPGTRIVTAPTSPNIILRNQDVISQTVIVSGDDTKITVKSSWINALELEYKVIDAIVFYGTAKKMPDALAALLKSVPPKEDALLMMKGETISGFYEKLNDKSISFNAGGQSKTYALEQVAALRLAATEKFQANTALNASLHLVDESVLTVKPIGIDGDALKVEALDGKTWSIAGTSIVSLEFSGGRMVFLSALTPKSVEQKPYVGGAPVVFTWRKDRSAVNGPLKIGETVYEKGVGVHSYCKLVYALNGEYEKFISDVGMDASAPAKAECAWRMVVDGKESVAGVARAGGEKRTVRIDVKQAKLLELICDFGPDDDDMGDRLDFGMARLIKP